MYGSLCGSRVEARIYMLYYTIFAYSYMTKVLEDQWVFLTKSFAIDEMCMVATFSNKKYSRIIKIIKTESYYFIINDKKSWVHTKTIVSIRFRDRFTQVTYKEMSSAVEFIVRENTWNYDNGIPCRI